MTPDTAVWISTARAGISYHRIDDTGRKTVCGRCFKTQRVVEGCIVPVIRGHVQPLAHVVELYGSQPCKTCNGSSVPPQIVPSRDRWTS